MRLCCSVTCCALHLPLWPFSPLLPACRALRSLGLGLGNGPACIPGSRQRRGVGGKGSWLLRPGEGSRIDLPLLEVLQDTSGYHWQSVVRARERLGSKHLSWVHRQSSVPDAIIGIVSGNGNPWKCQLGWAVLASSGASSVQPEDEADGQGSGSRRRMQPLCLLQAPANVSSPEPLRPARHSDRDKGHRAAAFLETRPASRAAVPSQLLPEAPKLTLPTSALSELPRSHPFRSAEELDWAA